MQLETTGPSPIPYSSREKVNLHPLNNCLYLKTFIKSPHGLLEAFTHKAWLEVWETFFVTFHWTFQSVHNFFEAWAPKLDRVLQVRLHQCQTWWKNHFPWFGRDTPVKKLQYVFSFLYVDFKTAEGVRPGYRFLKKLSTQTHMHTYFQSLFPTFRGRGEKIKFKGEMIESNVSIAQS